MHFVDERLKIILSKIEERIYKKRIKLDGLKYTECSYKGKENSPKEDAIWSDYSNLTIKNSHLEGSLNNGKDLHMWVKGKITLDDDFVGKTVDLLYSYEGVSPYFSRPQILIYLDSELVGAFDRTHFEFRIDSNKKEYDVLFYIYIGPNMNLTKLDFSIGLLEDEVYELYYDLMVPIDILSSTIDKNTVEYQSQLSILSDAVNILDLSLDYDSFLSSVIKCREFLKTEYYDRFADKYPCTVDAIGHTHIDVAWLWNFAQTREKTQRSFANFVHLMNRYPEFKLMHSTPQVYEFIKEDKPDLYEKIKEKVKTGQWQVEGSMWVEADCNLTSGESLVRQILYGKRFFKKEFDKDNRILWLPDVFGYSANLPQILKKSGVDYFVTSKISWNETNMLPYDVFYWTGIDGSKVFSYFLTAQNVSKDGKIETGVTYNGNTSAQMVEGTYRRFQQKDLVDEYMLTYGDGDGGGGPNVRKIEMARRQSRGIGNHPKVVFDQPLEFLDRVYSKVKNNNKVPKWNGELYLEYHRGTYTSQAKNKKYNRMCEFMIQNIETLALMNKELLSKDYPKDYIYKAWKDIMICQFHDVLPGSSIREVYDDSDIIYDNLEKEGNKYIDTYKENIMNNVKSDGGIIVFNPNSFVSSSTVKVNDEYVYVENIPAKGYKVCKFAPITKQIIDLNNRILENKYMTVFFDEKFNISNIYDKENHTYLIKEGEIANEIRAYEDYPRAYDNWEISEYYTEKYHSVDDLSSASIIDNGEKCGFEIVRKFNNSTITQKICLYGHENKLSFDTIVDFKEHHILLKTLFPIDVNTNKARFDIQYGNVERNTHKNTSWDWAKFEVCMHKYADISQYDHGVTFINDSKYGCSVDDTTFALTMLKSGTYPDPNADNCVHHFTYELCPHKGDMFSYGNIKKAYELNNPMTAYPIGKQDGLLSFEYSFVSCELDNVFIETIKECEDDEGIIVRLSEQFGSSGLGNLKLSFSAKEAYICDLLENEESKLDIYCGYKVPINIKPYEILTIKIKK